MIKRVAIIGGHIQALGLTRQVAKLGIDAVLLVDSLWAVARFSKCVSHVYRYSNNDELMQILQKLYLPDKSTLIFPTNDEAVEFLSFHYTTLNQQFAMGIPNPQLVTLFNDKRNAYQYVTAEGIPCPKCWYPNTMEEVQNIAQELPYPVVVKPGIMYSFHSTFGKKAYRCDNADDLLSIFQRIHDAQYPIDTLLIQEFLSGGPKYLYSYGVFAVDGEPQVSLMANRIRQNPMDFGNSTTFAVTCDIPQIEDQSKKLLQMVRYFGLGEVEWMYDPNTKEYKFLEINTRAWKWHTISNQLGFSFIGAMIDYYNGVTTEHPTATQTVGWVERLTDWTVSAKEILHGRMKVSTIKDSYKLPKENAVWQWSDPLPGIMYIVMAPILYIKRH
jgi:predicted ATP-grasp superfamily ATP-dependent carboligase